MGTTLRIATYRLTRKGEPYAKQIRDYLGATQLLNVWECSDTDRLAQCAQRGLLITINDTKQ